MGRSYSFNDTISVKFSQPTTLAGFALNAVLKKQQVPLRQYRRSREYIQKTEKIQKTKPLPTSS